MTFCFSTSKFCFSVAIMRNPRRVTHLRQDKEFLFFGQHLRSCWSSKTHPSLVSFTLVISLRDSACLARSPFPEGSSVSHPRGSCCSVWSGEDSEVRHLISVNLLAAIAPIQTILGGKETIPCTRVMLLGLSIEFRALRCLGSPPVGVEEEFSSTVCCLCHH